MSVYLKFVASKKSRLKFEIFVKFREIVTTILKNVFADFSPLVKFKCGPKRLKFKALADLYELGFFLIRHF